MNPNAINPVQLIKPQNTLSDISALINRRYTTADVKKASDDSNAPVDDKEDAESPSVHQSSSPGLRVTNDRSNPKNTGAAMTLQQFQDELDSQKGFLSPAAKSRMLSRRVAGVDKTL